LENELKLFEFEHLLKIPVQCFEIPVGRTIGLHPFQQR
jgi:hypothetical protein